MTYTYSTTSADNNTIYLRDSTLGGFHLVNASLPQIEATVAEIKAMAPDYVVPAHCMGFEAVTRIREEMAGRFLLNTAGTTYVLGG